MGGWAQGGFYLGWLPAGIVCVIMRWTFFGWDLLDDTTKYLGALLFFAVWLLCWFVGHLFDKHEKSNAELQSLKDKVDLLELKSSVRQTRKNENRATKA